MSLHEIENETFRIVEYRELGEELDICGSINTPCAPSSCLTVLD